MMWPWLPSVLTVALAGSSWLACVEDRDVSDPLTIRVRGSEYEWHVRYPGPDGEFGTADDVLGKRDVHVPDQTRIVIELDSEDYIYGFRIPDFGSNQMSVPELHFGAEFRADSPGSHALRGDQMCGYQHESLLGRVFVHGRSEYHGLLKDVVAAR